MEDNLIAKGHYAYMFRVDLSCNQNSKQLIEDWLELHEMTHWTGCHEIGKETGKHHYQMCVWREHKFLRKEQTKARNWWRGKTLSRTGGAALASARKILSLSSYSKKEEKSGKNTENDQLFSTLSNLSCEQLKRVPKWQSKRALKVQKQEKLKSTLKTVSKTLTKWQFLIEFNKIYYSIYGRPCTHRNTYINYLYEYEYLTNGQLIAYVFNINEFNPDPPGHTYNKNYWADIKPPKTYIDGYGNEHDYDIDEWLEKNKNIKNSILSCSE